MGTPSDKKRVIHEYIQRYPNGIYFTQYLRRGESPATAAAGDPQWTFSGRMFLVYVDETPDLETGTRSPLYPATFENHEHQTSNVLAAKDSSFGTANPTLRHQVDSDGEDLPPLGYVLDAPIPDRDCPELRQLWEERTTLPPIFAYDTASSRPGFSGPDNFIGGAVYTAPTLDFAVVVDADNIGDVQVRLKDLQTGEFLVGNNINVDPGDSLIRIQAPVGNCFATFSFGGSSSERIDEFTGDFLIHAWSPEEIIILDSNRATVGVEEYSFNLTLHNGDEFLDLDPKFINRSESSL